MCLAVAEEVVTLLKTWTCFCHLLLDLECSAHMVQELKKYLDTHSRCCMHLHIDLLTNTYWFYMLKHTQNFKPAGVTECGLTSAPRNVNKITLVRQLTKKLLYIIVPQHDCVVSHMFGNVKLLLLTHGLL